jgi:hypothetical protein
MDWLESMFLCCLSLGVIRAISECNAVQLSEVQKNEELVGELDK